jgi:hypothetical protein
MELNGIRGEGREEGGGRRGGDESAESVAENITRCSEILKYLILQYRNR